MTVHAMCNVVCHFRGAVALSQTAQISLPHHRRRWNLDQTDIAEAESADEQTACSPRGVSQSQGLASGQGQDVEGLVPLSVVMDACLVQGIMQQYRCVSKACLG